MWLPHDKILQHYNRKIRGILNYYTFAGNRSSLAKIEGLLRLSCALTLALKYKLKTMAKVFKVYGRDLTCEKSGYKLYRSVTLKAIHKFKGKTNIQLEDLEKLIREEWLSVTDPNLFKSCVICGGKDDIEMHHVRSIENVRARIRSGEVEYGELVGAMKRKQIPLCREHHNKLHGGELTREQVSKIYNYVKRGNPKKPQV